MVGELRVVCDDVFNVYDVMNESCQELFQVSQSFERKNNGEDEVGLQSCCHV